MKRLLVCLLLVGVLGCGKWAGEDPHLLRTIDSRTTGDFGAMLCVNSDGSEFASGIGRVGNELIIWDSEGFPRKRFTKNKSNFLESNFLDLQSKMQLHKSVHVRGIVFSPDWDEFVWYRQNRSRPSFSALGIWRLDGDAETYSLLPDFDQVRTLAIGPQAKRIAFYAHSTESMQDGLFIHWRGDSDKLITLEGVPEHGFISRMAFSPDGDRLVAVDLSSHILMWDLATERLTFALESIRAVHSEPIRNDTLVFSPDSKRFAVVERISTDNVIRVRSSVDGSIEKEFTIWHGNIVLGFSPDLKWYVTGNYGELKLHSLEDGGLVYTFKGHTREFHDAVFSGDSRRMVSSSYDGTYKIWDLTDIVSP